MAFHVMIKPAGARCNLACDYCYYLEKQQLYPGGQHKMSSDVLQRFTRQYIAAQDGNQVTFSWQGGEPLLMGIDFYREALERQSRQAKPGQVIQNAIQTNGLLLDDEWCRFFKRHDFLVGVSIDGPGSLHDDYRSKSLERACAGVDRLREHGVDFNILACVHSKNAGQPLEVYGFLRDRLQARYLQFIPVVVPGKEATVSGRRYGEFLKGLFEEWVVQDVGRVFVQLFESTLGVFAGYPAGLCAFSRRCGKAMVLEHNGDLYACDHFVDPGHRIGNIQETELKELANSKDQKKFGDDKFDSLPDKCTSCEVLALCNGGCPKNRLEQGQNWLCEGYRDFFVHVAPAMNYMAKELRAARSPANIMQVRR